MSYQYHTLKNGIKVIHRSIPGSVAHCGVMVNTGSRDEAPNESGLAHFMEHMIFKGTKKRKAYHVLSRIENNGGDLNAFTTKEETSVYASFLNPYYKQSLELFADVAFQSVFPQKELEKEKEVIIDEIHSYNDSPSELIFDDFENQLFHGHPLGRNILGDVDSVASFTRKDLFKFIKKNYSTNQMVIASVGNLPMKQLIRWTEEYFGDFRPNDLHPERIPFQDYQPSVVSTQKDSHLSHCMIGNQAYGQNEKKRFTMLLLSNLLGGPTLNSRLSMSLREKYGYAYTIESYYQPYSDTGVFGVYFGTEKNMVEKSLQIIRKEFKIMREKPLGTIQLHRAKKQIEGQVAIGGESFLNEMLGIAKSHLIYEKVQSIEELLHEMEQITASQVMEAANEILDESKLSTLTYQSK
jgi:predicted Zn-dependent peptidase